MNVVFVIVKILSVIMELFIVDFVFRSLRENRLDKIKRFLIYGTFIIVRSVAICFINFTIINLLISFTNCFLISLFYKIKWFKRVLVTIAMTLGFVLTEMLVGLIVSSLTSASIVEIQSNVVFFIESVLCSKLVMMIFAQAVRLIIRKDSSKLSVGMYAALFIMPVATCFIVFAASEVIYKNNDLYLTIIMIVGVISILIANYILMYVAEKNVKQIVDETTNEFLKQELVQQHKYYEDLISKYKFNNKKIHDIDKQLLVLNSMINANGFENAGQELLKVNQIVEGAKSIGFTGIASIDALLNNIEDKSKQYNIQFKKHIFIDEIVKTNEMDFCLLLGNLLDNAIEECLRLIEENKTDLFMICDIKKVDNYLNIVVENSCREKETLTTSKSNKYKHGYGLHIIDEIVQKFDGSIKRERIDGVFTTMIILNTHVRAV